MSSSSQKNGAAHLIIVWIWLSLPIVMLAATSQSTPSLFYASSVKLFPFIEHSPHSQNSLLLYIQLFIFAFFIQVVAWSLTSILIYFLLLDLDKNTWSKKYWFTKDTIENFDTNFYIKLTPRRWKTCWCMIYASNSRAHYIHMNTIFNFFKST